MQPSHVATAIATPGKPFKLTRFFSVASFIGVGVVSVCLIWLYGEQVRARLIAQESRASAQLSQAFVNALVPRHQALLSASAISSVTPAQFKALDTDIRNIQRGLQVAKIKIYSTTGLTIFSTDTAQIGEDKSRNPGFRVALAGGVESNLTRRGKLDTFEGVISDRDVIATYAPVKSEAGGAAAQAVASVFEVYSDVTELLVEQNRALQRVTLIVIGVLGLLYGFLLLVIRRADVYMALQEQVTIAQAEHAEHQARHDHLTGLPNRAYFMESAAQQLAVARRTQSRLALLFMDLDHFKEVNDSLGHECGDKLLRAVAERISACLRESDRLFRMGGDEFIVLLPGVSDQEGVVLAAQRIGNSLLVPFRIDNRELTVGVTIGLAIYPDGGLTVEELLKNADSAMYSAKASGRGTYAAYLPSMSEEGRDRLAHVEAVHNGFRDGEMRVYFQPVVRAGSLEIASAEALIRWHRPGQAPAAPSQFLAALEDTGFMHYVGEWVLRTACEHVGQLTGAAGNLRVAINFSPSQITHPEFLAMLTRVLAETQFPPERLIVEVTENGLLRKTPATVQTMAALRDQGIKIAIDDFGTGYSSLSYLRQLHVDILKIDRSFCAEVDTEPRDYAIVKSICEVAKALGLSVVAEGVETEAQAQRLTELGCDGLQGYFFAKPMLAAELAAYLDMAVARGQAIA